MLGTGIPSLAIGTGSSREEDAETTSPGHAATATTTRRRPDFRGGRCSAEAAGFRGFFAQLVWQRRRRRKGQRDWAPRPPRHAVQREDLVLGDPGEEQDTHLLGRKRKKDRERRGNERKKKIELPNFVLSILQLGVRNMFVYFNLPTSMFSDFFLHFRSLSLSLFILHFRRR